MTLPDPASTELAPNADAEAATEAGYALIPVVGLGGSAGAIEALEGFLRAARADAGFAYVVILHLSPVHESALAEVLQRHTSMPVRQVSKETRVERDTVYVIPPGQALQMNDGLIRLAPLPRDKPGRVAVDLFFRTLADSHGPHAVAIVLSGMDGDGAVGIKRIKERGGLTIAQAPEEALHDDMPRAAIATGMVDWILSVGEMPRRVQRYLELEVRLHLPRKQEADAYQAEGSTITERELREILASLRTRTGRDFSNYKRATMLRRIGRRMQINGTPTVTDYLACLRTRPGESGALQQELLISVTNFFRDPECFDALAREIPAMLDRADGTLRVWVPACATGEEAYSIAMLLAEHSRTLASPPAVQVFATDLDEEAIRIARDGLYPDTIATDVSQERLRRFFVREHQGWRVRRELREQVLFAEHDLLKDPPFSRLDLVSCRNLQIYLNRDGQRRVLEVAHFALRPQGRLFLGASETVEDNHALFYPVDKKHRVFAARQLPRSHLPALPGPGILARALDLHEPARASGGLPRASAQAADAAPSAIDVRPARGPGSWDGRPASWAELHFKMLEMFAPPSIVIDGAHEIMHVSASAGRFLQLGGGEPTRNLLQLIHPGLRSELRAAIYKAGQATGRAELAPTPLEIGGQVLLVKAVVAAMADIAPGMMLVTLDAQPAGDAAEHVAAEGAQEDGDALATLLERELDGLKSQLRYTVEQYEASTEELKASNEELQAMNEEMRSATEELETSREELQSINEELTTVNHDLKGKVEELGHANGDLQNLMDATAIATVFLDRELCIARYTPTAVTLFNLIATDVGRPLSHMTNRLDYPQLEADARRTLQELVPVEREVADADGRSYLARTRPYRTGEDRISGVVLTLIDVTERKRSQAALRLSEERFGAIGAALREPLAAAEQAAAALASAGASADPGLAGAHALLQRQLETMRGLLDELLDRSRPGA
ncbi:MAG: chemotaxis protein CheB [Burkholderiaceae bacterium]